MDEPNPAISAVVVLVGLLALLIVWWRGRLREAIFARCPRRGGSLGVADILVTLGLLLLGPGMVVATVLGPRSPGEAMDADQLLKRMALVQVGMLPAVVYVLARAAVAVDGGLAAFGFGVRRFGRTMASTLLTTVAVLPLTVAMSAVVVLILLAVGQEPPAVAHEALRAMQKADQPAIRWGLIAAAVGGAPLVEEIVFRGLIQTSLRHARIVLSRWGAIALASLVFTGIHIGAADWVALPALFVLSLGLGFLYERTGSLWASILMHALFNASQIAFTLYPAP